MLPPNFRRLIILSFLVVLIFGLALALKNIPGSATWVWQISNQGKFLLPLVGVAALVDSINPCAFSVLLVSLIFLFSLGQSHRRIFSMGLSYIFGIFVVYLLIGLGILQALHIFNVPHFMSKLAAGLLILFGAINVLEVWFPNFPLHFRIPASAHAKMNELLKTVSIPGMFLLGALVGACEFPCTGGPYLIVIGLLHDTKTYWQGVGYLLLYNLIFILPLLAIMFLASNQTMVEKIKIFQRSNSKLLKIGGGLLMIALAFIILNL
ncbi:MAG: hypothetical protein A3B10_03655 [Candidatus Doudnabacteria bacterium RIFCSPLOWO2_01_FULL_44_21]|uniref:Uncharacterized protein n=1 Tax=Candidatus Doudnabacteria bacterium RIFCSPLOWO2_01_FULL_44_21 TaxID=1817841 RepID=A0A1F5PY60_9BACT|nr:MAG: hypothetical protein A3B95_02190 [Candidatus Doudnabacteria bacterium RIFCSPHIGHO2_02_FULL_43_13b]OGE94859.1 MAG: hypothetical protein A3B10_03655 [Candidatus Doudnabacteria bacterium RIFCSPLOWO2_01_FULL_44_21]